MIKKSEGEKESLYQNRIYEKLAPLNKLNSLRFCAENLIQKWNRKEKLKPFKPEYSAEGENEDTFSVYLELFETGCPSSSSLSHAKARRMRRNFKRRGFSIHPIPLSFLYVFAFSYRNAISRGAHLTSALPRTHAQTPLQLKTLVTVCWSNGKVK